MKLLQKKVFTQDDILEIINSNLEESINIEFKSSGSLSKIPNVKKEISKDVSAFANSDGGIIFYGIQEENHIACSLSFIDGNLYNKEWLENIIISSIQNRISFEIIPVRFNNDFLKTIYVVKIPKSDNAPHINADKKYYRRYNFQSVPMEEYEIRNLYLSQKNSQVFANSVTVKPKQKNENFYEFYIEVQVINEGKYVSDKYKIGCNIVDAVGISVNYETNKNYTFTNDIGNGIKISTNDIIPIFPNEIFNALSFNIQIPKLKFNSILKTLKFFVLSYNTIDYEEIEFDLAKLLLKNKERHY